MPASIRQNISNTSSTSSNTGRFHCRLKAWRCISRRSTISLPPRSLSFCKLSINDPGSVVVLRALGAFFGIAQFVLVFLTLRLLLPVRTALVGSLAGGFSTNAFVSDALCDERNSHRHSRDVDGLSLLASAQERNAVAPHNLSFLDWRLARRC